MANPNKGSSAVIEVGTDGTTFAGIGGITDFSFSLTVDGIEVTDFDSDNFKEMIAGDKQASGDISLNYEDGDSGQDTLFTQILTAGSNLFWRVRPAGTGTGKKQITFKSILTDTSLSTPENDKVTLSFSYQSTGEITIADQS